MGVQGAIERSHGREGKLMGQLAVTQAGWAGGGGGDSRWLAREIGRDA